MRMLPAHGSQLPSFRDLSRLDRCSLAWGVSCPPSPPPLFCSAYCLWLDSGLQNLLSPVSKWNWFYRWDSGSRAPCEIRLSPHHWPTPSPAFSSFPPTLSPESKSSTNQLNPNPEALSHKQCVGRPSPNPSSELCGIRLFVFAHLISEKEWHKNFVFPYC